MKRIILCASILLFICISSFMTLNMLKKNTLRFSSDLEDISNLYQLERYDEAYRKADVLYSDWNKFCRTASVIVDLDRLEEIKPRYAYLLRRVLRGESGRSIARSEGMSCGTINEQIERAKRMAADIWNEVI